MLEGKQVIKADPSVVYNYQELLSQAVCYHCGERLEWKLSTSGNDDRFCYAECCATRFSMVAESVRVVMTLAVAPDHSEDDVENQDLADQDFLKALEGIVES